MNRDLPVEKPAENLLENPLISGPDRRPDRADFLSALFPLLEEHEVCYCRLEYREGTPNEEPSEVILVLPAHDGAKLPAVFQRLRELGYPPVQSAHCAMDSDRIAFASLHGSALSFVTINFMYRFRLGNVILKTGEALVAGRQKRDNYWVAAPENEFYHLLAKTSLQKTISRGQHLQLQTLAKELGRDRAEKIADELFGERWRRAVVMACAAGSAGELLPRARKQLWSKNLGRNPFNLVRYGFGEGLRIIRSWFQPSGLFVVLLGPDGVGKSTLARQIVSAFKPIFQTSRIFHWRPAVIWRIGALGQPVSCPHFKPPRGTWLSIAFLLATFVDVWLGYQLVARRVMARPGLVIFDRYFPDVLVDPVRYRYGGPIWLSRLVTRFVPPRNVIFLVLDAEENVVFSRKQDLPVHELKRQRGGYKLLAANLTCSVLLRTDQVGNPSLAQASAKLVDHLARDFERRHESSLAGNVTLAPTRSQDPAGNARSYRICRNAINQAEE
jgi:thymidylate kinase